MTSGSERRTSGIVIVLSIAAHSVCSSAEAQPLAAKIEPPEQSTAADLEPLDGARSAARDLATRAMDLMRKRRWTEAQRLLEQAYSIVPAPTLALLEGEALVKLGRLRRAADRFRAAQNAKLDDASPHAYKKAVLLAEVRLREVERRTPRLTLRVERSGAATNKLGLLLNGEPQSPQTLGVERSMDPGNYELLVQHPSGRTYRRAFVLREGDRQTVSLDLTSDAAVRMPPAADRQRIAHTDVRRPAGWVSLGIAGAGLGTGVVASVVMANKHSVLDEECNPECPPGLRDDLETFETARTISLVGYGTGLLGGVLGAVLLMGSRPAETQARAVRPFITSKTVGVKGTF